MPRIRRVLILLTAAALGALALAGPAAAKDRIVNTKGMYGDRYCEYLVLKGTLPNLTGTVWNTYGLNDCPEALWKATDVAALKAELGALSIVLNGPRYWLIDRAQIYNPLGVRDFHGLKMRELTTLNIPLVDGVPKQLPYTEVTVNRRTTFTWKAGRTIHELLAPNGRRYTMQAYSQIVDPALQRGQLSALGSRLKLPAGWRYRNRVLKKDMPVTTYGHTTVLQDELQNTYQRSR